MEWSLDEHGVCHAAYLAMSGNTHLFGKDYILAKVEDFNDKRR